jgi:membrane fusion protein (multidrug efflux system)
MINAKHIVVAVLTAVGLAALAAVAYYANRSLSPQQAAGGPGAPGPGMAGARPGGAPAGAGPGGFAMAVEAVKVQTATLPDDLTAVGTLRANESVVLRPEIAGRIARIAFREGVPVAKGALLVALDDSTQAADLQQARANLNLAKTNFQRTVDLYQRKFVSEQAQDEAAAKLKVQEAVTAQAEARLAKTRIVAPFAGIIGIRNVSVGDYVKEGQDLVNLEDISSLKADFRLPERYFARLKSGQTVEVTTDARPGEVFKATVDAIDPLLDSTGRAILVRARLPNREARLRPGMFARVRLIVGDRHDALVIPEEALVPAGSDQFVFRVVDGKAQRVKIQIGARRNARVEVIEGLKAGDVVVTAGQLKIRDGAPVKVAEPSSAQPAGGMAGSPDKR